MGVIGTVTTGIAALVGAVASRLAYDELKAWSPRLVDRLVRRAVVKLPEPQRERMAEEWASHLLDTPGEAGKLIAALGFSRAARKLNRKPLPIRRILRIAFRRDLTLEIFLVMEIIETANEEDGKGITLTRDELIRSVWKVASTNQLCCLELICYITYFLVNVNLHDLLFPICA